MMTQVRLVQKNSDDIFDTAAETVKNGGVIAFPTDTFYGLGCDPFNESAVEKIFSIKQRRADMPLLVLVDSLETVSRLSLNLSEKFRLLAEHCWPGPLTIVLEAVKELPQALTAGTGTIGVRLPDSPFPRQLAAKCGGAITATSANLSGQSNPLTAQDVVSQLGDGPDLIIDGGTCQPIPSTVVTLCTSPPRILRVGGTSVDALQSLIPDFAFDANR
jgi:L-threonylcarbamoyladenylate synthase